MNLPPSARSRSAATPPPAPPSSRRSRRPAAAAAVASAVVPQPAGGPPAFRYRELRRADDAGAQAQERRRRGHRPVAAGCRCGGGGYWYYSTTTRPGRIEVTATPGDATVLVDNVKVGDHSPVSLDKPPGPYTLSVIRDGYVRSDQNVEVRAGQRLPLAVALEPSPDTGFELTSEPPGGLVWLDGAPIKGASGQQARTDFRAFRITPGHHVLEIKGEDRFKPWRQDVDVQPGAIQKVHAPLLPAGGRRGVAPARGRGRCATAAAPTPPAPAPEAPPAAPPTPARSPLPTAARTTHVRGGGARGTPDASARRLRPPRRPAPRTSASPPRRRRRLFDHRELGPLVRGLDRRQEHDPAHAAGRLQGPLRQAQAVVQADRHADRPHREHHGARRAASSSSATRSRRTSDVRHDDDGAGRAARRRCCCRLRAVARRTARGDLARVLPARG